MDLGFLARSVSSGGGSPVAGYRLWLDAQDNATFTLSGSDVLTWTDKGYSSTVFHTTAGTPTVANNINGHQTVAMTNSGEILNSNGNLNLVDIIGSTTATCFGVCSINNTGTGCLLGVNTPDLWNFGFPVSSIQMLYITQDTSYYGPYQVEANPGSALSTGFIFVSQTNGATISAKIPPGSFNNITQDIPGQNFSGTTLLVGSFNGSDSLDGNIGEILVYNTALSSGDIASNVSYLASKWGV